MNNKELYDFITTYDFTSPRGKLICNLNQKKRGKTRLISNLGMLPFVYIVGKSKRKKIREMTVFEEMLELLGENDKVVVYAEKRELSLSRINRPLSSLSSEKWRASIAIGFLTGKKVFFIPEISIDVIKMYWNIWMKNLFQECLDSGITIIFNSNSGMCKDIQFDIVL